MFPYKSTFHIDTSSSPPTQQAIDLEKSRIANYLKASRKKIIYLTPVLIFSILILFFYITMHSFEFTFSFLAALFGCFLVSSFSVSYFKYIAGSIFSSTIAIIFIYILAPTELRSFFPASVVTDAVASSTALATPYHSGASFIFSHLPILACGILIPALIVFIAIVSVEGLVLQVSKIKELCPYPNERNIELLCKMDPLAAQYHSLVKAKGRPLTSLEYHLLMR